MTLFFLTPVTFFRMSDFVLCAEVNKYISLTKQEMKIVFRNHSQVFYCYLVIETFIYYTLIQS